MITRLLSALLLFTTATFAQQSHWVSTWYTPPAPQLAAVSDQQTAKMIFNNQTLRQIFHTTVGGRYVRVAVSNVYGVDFLQVGSMHLALRTATSSIAAGSDHVLSFSGRISVSVPPNAVMLSDPVYMDVPAAGDLTVSIYLPQATAGAGIHYSPSATSYIGAGDQTAATSFKSTTTVASWAFVASVEVLAPAATATIVTFGDSITDGAHSTADANHRWPDYLAARLLAAGLERAVVDSGISGNRIIYDPPVPLNIKFGVNGLSRFERDVLARPGAKYVIILEGINDLGHPGSASAPISQSVTADDLIAGLQQMADRAHEMGLKVVIGTLTPFNGYSSAGYYTPEKDAQRAVINQWIRTTTAIDAFVDFDAVVRDPADPSKLLAAYDSGDHLHPGDAGYQAMANAIDLTWFTEPAAGTRR